MTTSYPAQAVLIDCARRSAAPGFCLLMMTGTTCAPESMYCMNGISTSTECSLRCALGSSGDEFSQPHRDVLMDGDAAHGGEVIVAAHDALIGHAVMVGADHDVRVRPAVLGQGLEGMGRAHARAFIAGMGGQDCRYRPLPSAFAGLAGAGPEAPGDGRPQLGGVGGIETSSNCGTAHMRIIEEGT
ncbi:hypothetical protein AUQ37_00600 [Candidatus Methanomethylophilus sp. 1R26]|nr:hypothetical protein [Candidatus Methanomethylophilus sp. 1R26]KUE73866.1 hypothetical protein AUQ37_00600 [Candidatus Methanomethylophilus sp. 1R26]